MINLFAIKYTKVDGYYWSDELELFSPDYIKLFYNEEDAQTYFENHPYLKNLGKVVSMTLQENETVAGYNDTVTREQIRMWFTLR